MSFIKKIRSWLSHHSQAPEDEKTVRTLLLKSLVVISAYGEVVERLNSSPQTYLKHSETELPFDKEEIKKATSILQGALHNSALRTILVKLLTLEQAQQILSPQFEQSLALGLIILESFIPDAEAKHAHQEWDETLEIVHNLRNQMRESGKNDKSSGE